ncbi:hypothetical protein L6164_037062 [Bauhinia variegata]|uniref:Uncharacterized protein n=1 Tax=Bauhinia variegata TaxID=167791 RepID=A0ACB9KJ37_BAUVA|nr:hypothetical protein L6164_037062 [Bauhinia variegata]
MAQKFAVYYNIIMILWPIASLASAQVTNNLAKPGCNYTCGSFDIPYPFGMNDPNCYADKWFEIECGTINVDTKQPFLKFLDLMVSNISTLDSTIEVWNPVQRMNCSEDQPKGNVVDLRGSPFVYSQRNTFYAVGCNSLALLNANGAEIGGCVSICDNDEDANSETIDGCHGRYCCETSLPRYLSEFNTTFQVLGENGVNVRSGQCNYAMITTDFFGPQGTQYVTQLRAIFEWEITNSSVQLPQSSNCYPSNITSSDKNSSGLRCQCRSGFEGNPYISGGCTAIPDSSNKKSRAKWAIIGVFSSLGSILLLLGIWWLYKIVRKRMIEKRKEKNFKENGGLLLQQRLSSGEVNVEKTKLFSLKDLEKATDHFNLRSSRSKEKLKNL